MASSPQISLHRDNLTYIQDSRICNLTYCRIEEVQEITVREEDHVPQSRITTLELAAPFTRPRPQITVSEDDDFTRYSRIQVIDTSFQLQRAGEDGNLAGLETLSVLDLNDLERLAAYLARVHGLPEEDCLVALRECELQVQTIRGEHDSGTQQEGYAKCAPTKRRLWVLEVGAISER